MRINPAEIKVDYGNGRVETLGSVANWERIQTAIDRLFQWDTSYPDPFAPLPQAATEQTATEESVEIAAPATVLDPNLRIIDRIVIALGKSRGPLTMKATYQKMVADGYENQAIKPVSNVHSRIRKYPSLIALTQGKVRLLPAGRELFHQLEANGFQGLSAGISVASDNDLEQDNPDLPTDASPKASVSFYSSNKSELTGTDYLLRALYKLGGSATLDELIDPMVDYGWRPNSDTRLKKKHNVSALVYTSREYVDRERGRATLNTKGLERLKSGVLIIDNRMPIPPLKQNSPPLDLEEASTGLFIQT